MGSGSSTASIDMGVLGSHESRSMSTQPEGNFETVLISSDSELDTMASKEGESSSGSSTASIEFSVRGSHGSRSMSTQTEGDFETVFISSDSEPSGNSETTNRTETTQDPLCVNVSPLIFESQYSELSNVGTQSEDPNKCRQNFATESDTQCKSVLVCPEDADESNEDPDESTENADETTENVDERTENADETTENLDESTENADETTENVDESTENADETTDTVILETSDYTENTQTLLQYVRGSDTQDNSQEMYPDTLS